MDPVTQLLDIIGLDEPIRVVDIGANPIEETPPYKPLLEAGLATLVGFEPQAEALALLQDAASDRETFLPDAVGDGGELPLHMCAYSGWTSTLRPDPRSIELFHTFAQNAAVVEEITIATRRLDDIAEVGPIDFLKIDIQGGEPAVFAHGRAKLAGVLMVHTEASLFPLYEGQPPFGQIDLMLRDFGLLPHHLVHVKRGIIAPMVLGEDRETPINQVLEADIVYARDIRDHAAMSDTALRKLAAMAHFCYKSFDLTMHCLKRLNERGTTTRDLVAEYLALLNQPSEPE